MRQKKLYVLLTALVAAVGGMASPAALADKASDDAAIARYREMIADGNPAELVAGQGEELWKTKRGPKNASLEKCDLGLGPGVLKGASAKLPRYFKDTGRVQDLETRLLTCMETLQGIDPKTVIDAKWLKGERETMAALVAYVVTQSNGQKIDIDMTPPQMKKMYELARWLSTIVPAPWILPAPPVTAIRENASVCRICRICERKPARRRAGVPGRPIGSPAVNSGPCSIA